VGFEFNILLIERAKTVYVLDLEATVIGSMTLSFITARKVKIYEIHVLLGTDVWILATFKRYKCIFGGLLFTE
jgi:hypothetical protein